MDHRTEGAKALFEAAYAGRRKRGRQPREDDTERRMRSGRVLDAVRREGFVHSGRGREGQSENAGTYDTALCRLPARCAASPPLARQGYRFDVLLSFICILLQLTFPSCC